jgi:hypothetical protein
MNNLSTVDAQQAVSAVLQDYTSRGVFQHYRAEPRKNGVDFHFGWLYGQPFTLGYEPKRRRLSLVDLLPNVEANSMMHKEIKVWLKSRAAANVPDHRRVDPALARTEVRLRDGTLSLALEAANEADHEYCTRKIINLTHELFLFMNEYWADYMWENFQMNME